MQPLTEFDLSVPLQLTFALGPDLLLMIGAMILLLWAAWRPESAAHQRSVASASIVLAIMTGASVWFYLMRGFSASPDRKSTRLNSSHGYISYAVFCLKKKKGWAGRC